MRGPSPRFDGYHGVFFRFDRRNRSISPFQQKIRSRKIEPELVWNGRPLRQPTPVMGSRSGSWQRVFELSDRR